MRTDRGDSSVFIRNDPVHPCPIFLLFRFRARSISENLFDSDHLWKIRWLKSFSSFFNVKVRDRNTVGNLKFLFEAPREVDFEEVSNCHSHSRFVGGGLARFGPG